MLAYVKRVTACIDVPVFSIVFSFGKPSSHTNYPTPTLRRQIRQLRQRVVVHREGREKTQVYASLRSLTLHSPASCSYTREARSRSSPNAPRWAGLHSHTHSLPHPASSATPRPRTVSSRRRWNAVPPVLRVIAASVSHAIAPRPP